MEGSIASLAEIELETAKELILNDPRIAELLGEYIDDVEVEMLLTSTGSPEDVFYQKRVVYTMLKTSMGYPEIVPKIFVNLTDLEVVIDE